MGLLFRSAKTNLKRVGFFCHLRADDVVVGETAPRGDYAAADLYGGCLSSWVALEWRNASLQPPPAPNWSK